MSEHIMMIHGMIIICSLIMNLLIVDSNKIDHDRI